MSWAANRHEYHLSCLQAFEEAWQQLRRLVHGELVYEIADYLLTCAHEGRSFPVLDTEPQDVPILGIDSSSALQHVAIDIVVRLDVEISCVGFRRLLLPARDELVVRLAVNLKLCFGECCGLGQELYCIR